jgi:AAA ATPase domain
VLVCRSGPTGLPFQAAARMLQDAEAGAVLIGNRTVSAAGSATRVSPFVGREQQIGALMSVARSVRSPRLVTIVGDAGIGKSRLVRELQGRLAAEMPQVRQFMGRCLSYGRGLTYHALGEVLSAVRAQPEAALASRQILDLTLGLDVAGDLHPLAAFEQLRLAWVELIEGLASERPVLLVIEDLHWAQPDLLDVLEQLVSEVVGPLLLVCTARPELLEARPSWGRRREATTLWLEPLEPGDAARLVEDAPAGVRGAVLERAEGNPFFLEELMACIGKGGDLDAAAISDSIHAVLAARIDQLPRLEKEALQAASVIGRIFWREAVEALLGGVPASFLLLEDRDFVRPRPGSSLEGARELTFKHALTCEVAYGTLPRARRAQLHGDFARWLEALGGGPDEHAALLAHHYYEASGADSGKLRERALHWLRRSGELAIARYEIEEALALLRRALKLETDDTGRCAIYRAIARANALKFDGEAFWSAMEKAADLAPDDVTRAEIISQLAVESFVRAGMWTRTPAIEQIGEWVARALELAHPGTASRARALTAKAALDLDDREAAAEAAAIAERLGDLELCVHAWDACGAAAMVAADYEVAWRWRTRRLELLECVTDPDLRTIIGETPYASCIATARFAQAREIAQLHAELTRPLTPHHRMHGAAILVEVEELLGGWEAIRAQEAQVMDAVAANAATPCLRNARSLLVCALAAACLDDDRRATEMERAAAALGLLGRQVIDAPRLRLALLRGDHDQAERLLAGLLDESGWYARGHGTSLATLTTRIDALAVLGRTERVEQEAPRLLQPGT